MKESIETLNRMKLKQQSPTPDPVLIDDLDGNQLIVFTSYMRQKYASFEQVPLKESNGNKDKTDSSYPTVFFYSVR